MSSRCARAGAAEPVDGLGVVADHGERGRRGAGRREDVDLQRVDVLVLVDADVVDLAGERGPSTRRRPRGPPVEEQVVEVEQARAPLAGDVAPADGGDRLEPVGAPRARPRR